MDTEPQLIHKVKPRYPRNLARRGVEGRVTVDIFVDGAGGQPYDVKLVKSSGQTVMDHNAMRAAYKFRFRPVRRLGRPTSDRHRHTFIFRLEH